MVNKLIRKILGEDQLIINIQSQTPESLVVKIVDATNGNILSVRNLIPKKRNEKLIVNLPYRDYVLSVEVNTINGKPVKHSAYLKSDTFYSFATGNSMTIDWKSGGIVQQPTTAVTPTPPVSGQAMVIVNPSLTTGRAIGLTVVGSVSNVDWGDGSPLENISNATAIHTYAASSTPLFTIHFDDNGCTGLGIGLNATASIATFISIDGFSGLTMLGCGNNQLTTLRITGDNAVANLKCSNNRLTGIDITFIIPTLSNFDCSRNTLTSTSVNSILASLVSGSINSGTLKLETQAPLAPPTGQGITDVATLEAAPRLWNVTTD
jgi:hypothetical protein